MEPGGGVLPIMTAHWHHGTYSVDALLDAHFLAAAQRLHQHLVALVYVLLIGMSITAKMSRDCHI